MEILKKTAIVLAALAGLLVLAIAVFGDRDISPEVLKERYANEASRFVELDSGTVAHVRDRGTPTGDAQKFAAALPNCWMRVYPGVGHIPMVEAPERSAADARAFLRGEI